jgi:hypothetical protein
MLQFVSKSLRRSRGVLVTAGLLSLLAAPAGALSVAVTYDIDVVITSTQAGGQSVLTGPGSLTVRFNNASGLHASAGGLKVLSGSLSLDNAITLGSNIMITGNQIQMFGNGGNGSVNSLGAFALSTVGTITSGVLHCTGILCGVAGFPISVPVPLTGNPAVLNITAGMFAGFPSLGPQTFTGMGTAGQAGDLILTITGQEVSRTQVVPEPGTGMLLGLGLAGFGIAGGLARRRR